ncbi:hypothetical protein DYB32_007403, partial [Aphanomyces invadans]
APQFHVAINDNQYDYGVHCGRCVSVTCVDARCPTKRSVMGQITDRCPECSHGDLDMSLPMFQQVTGFTTDRLAISWDFVDCPVAGGVQVCAKSGSSIHWLYVQPDNAVNGVKSMRINGGDAPIFASAYYFMSTVLGTVDLSRTQVEMTSHSGETIRATVALVADQCTQIPQQFGGDSAAHIGSYSPTTGFIFLFNLVVGTGALTIPHAFAQVGLLYGAFALFLLSVVSYVSGTYVIEAIAGVNALQGLQQQVKGVSASQARTSETTTANTSSIDDTTSEAVPFLVHTNVRQPSSPVIALPFIVNLKDFNQADEEYVSGLHFDISKKELFSPRGVAAFYVCMIAYLYGDLAIYAVGMSSCSRPDRFQHIVAIAIPKSLREVICPRPTPNVTVWNCPELHMSSTVLYRALVALFGISLAPFAMGHMQKTALIQIVTTIMRHLSFMLMIVLACVGIAQGHGRPIADVLSHSNLGYLPNVFGICIYSFMCHHRSRIPLHVDTFDLNVGSHSSLPGIIAPISKKRAVRSIFLGAFIAVFVLYIVLSFSATFRYLPEHIQDVYTLNFTTYPNAFIAYFLSLFPVFTLSTTFPIIAITLRENLRTLFHANSSQHVSDMTLFALLAIVPPLVIAFFTEDVGMLVGITGAYAGLAIQWVIPASFVYCLRQRLDEVGKSLKLQGAPKNPFASSFGGVGWLALLMGLSAVSLLVITYTRVFK